MGPQLTPPTYACSAHGPLVRDVRGEQADPENGPWAFSGNSRALESGQKGQYVPWEGMSPQTCGPSLIGIRVRAGTFEAKGTGPGLRLRRVLCFLPSWGNYGCFSKQLIGRLSEGRLCPSHCHPLDHSCSFCDTDVNLAL